MTRNVVPGVKPESVAFTRPPAPPAVLPEPVPPPDPETDTVAEVTPVGTVKLKKPGVL